MVDAATSLTELYTWNNDGTLASAPGSGYTKLFEYDEEQHLTRIQHNTGGTITTAYEYGYAADGGRRWRKDYAGGVWTWYPCGVACNAGELVEQTSTLAGGTWTTSALYLKGGSGCSSQIIRRNGEYHHVGIAVGYALISAITGTLVSSGVYDTFGVQRYMNGTAQTPWQGDRQEDEGLVSISDQFYLSSRQVVLQQAPQQKRKTKQDCSDEKELCYQDVNAQITICTQFISILCAGGLLVGIWKCGNVAKFCAPGGPVAVATCGILCGVVLVGGCALASQKCNDLRGRLKDCLTKYRDCMRTAV